MEKGGTILLPVFIGIWGTSSGVEEGGNVVRGGESSQREYMLKCGSFCRRGGVFGEGKLNHCELAERPDFSIVFLQGGTFGHKRPFANNRIRSKRNRFEKGGRVRAFSVSAAQNFSHLKWRTARRKRLRQGANCRP